MSCGAPLDESESFCSRCGTRCGTAAPPVTQQQTQNQQQFTSGKKSKALIIVAILGVIWAIFAIFYGAYFIVSANDMVSQLGPDYLDLLDNIGVSIDAVAGMFVAIGAVLVISGVLAAITAVLCLLKRFYIIALIACILSALLGLIMIVGVIGLFIAFFIYKSKHEFKGGNRNIL